MNNPCVIVECSDCDDWPARLNYLPAVPTVPRLIPVARRPAVLQPDRATADGEALRLAGAHPGKRFVVFEAVAVATTVEVPSHVTVGGKVFAMSLVPKLLETVDSEAPL